MWLLKYLVNIMKSTPEDDEAEQQLEQRHNLKFDRDKMTAMNYRLCGD